MLPAAPLPAVGAADLLGHSLHLLLLHLLLLLHWQWAVEHLLHLAHSKTVAHW